MNRFALRILVALLSLSAYCVAEEPLEATNSIGVRLRFIPAGKFRMGEYEKATVVTKPFWIGVHEVTNAQWKKVMGAVPSRVAGDDMPVTQVDWKQATEFCRALSELPAEKAAGRVYRLPTEAEWEYSCRAGTTTMFSFGDDTETDPHAWLSHNSENKPHPVGQKKPNAWGLFDMHGNVWELCLDKVDRSSAPQGGIDPAGYQDDSDGPLRIAKGGSFGTGSQGAGSADRLQLSPEDKEDNRGFRVVAVDSNSAERGYLGFAIQPAPAGVRGVLVAGVAPQAPAEVADIRVGDIIVRFEKEEVSDPATLAMLLSRVPVGREVTMDLVRDGKRFSVSVKSGRRPKP